MRNESPNFENMGLDIKKIILILQLELLLVVISIFDFGHKRRASWIFRRLRKSDQMYHDRFEEEKKTLTLEWLN